MQRPSTLLPHCFVLQSKVPSKSSRRAPNPHIGRILRDDPLLVQQGQVSTLFDMILEIRGPILFYAVNPCQNLRNRLIELWRNLLIEINLH